MELKLPVRQLVEFLLRSGSIDARFSGFDRAVKGGRIHRMLQRSRGEGYRAELSLSAAETVDGVDYKVYGRADGVTDVGGIPAIEEIKTTDRLLEPLRGDEYPAHWAQGLCYAYMLCKDQGLNEAYVRLTYCNIDTLEERSFERCYEAKRLKEEFLDLLTRYGPWARLTLTWKEERAVSLRALEFPFPAYREGQRKLAANVYRAARAGARLIASAPTGVGKTLSCVFPCFKAMGEGFGDKLFYLTAKNVAASAAQDAVGMLNANLRSITLTSKDKACPLEERACIPERCAYARDYFDRVNGALFQILNQERAITRERAAELAEKYMLCPHELSLDIAVWSDAIIGDYNYLFDPNARLQRFFEGKTGDYLFLVDEAHNLADRAREMYSARLLKGAFLSFKNGLLKDNKTKRLRSALTRVNSAFISVRHALEEAETDALVIHERPEGLMAALSLFLEAAEAYLESDKGGAHEKELLSLYFDARFFQRVYDMFDDTYSTMLLIRGRDVSVKLCCMDPAPKIDECLSKGRAAALFSATLSPLDYYKTVLGLGEDAGALMLPSPYDPGRFGLFASGSFSTRYAHREANIGGVSDMIYAFVSARPGNYMVYFPNYEYMGRVYERFAAEHPGVAAIIQRAGAPEPERCEFLARFNDMKNPVTGFCVLGGVFAEGVDLPGNRLIGAVIVGVGLPRVGPDADMLRDYYQSKGMDGFAYAYRYPGFNKVMQAAGRVIRGEGDKGAVLLIDDRFNSPVYRRLFPPHWSHCALVTPETLPNELTRFWERE